MEIVKNGNVTETEVNIWNENFVKFINKSITFKGTENRLYVDNIKDWKNCAIRRVKNRKRTFDKNMVGE